MRKYFVFFTLIISFTNQSAMAQISVNLNISYPAPTYLSDWNNSRAGIVSVILNTAGQQEATQIKFRTQLQNSNGIVIAASNDANARTYNIRSGATTFTLDKALQLENLQFVDGSIINKIQTTGKLPADNYTLCIELLNSQGDVSLTKVPVCRPFMQINYQLPYLLMPTDKAWLDANIAQSVITFRWSSLVPVIKEGVVYRLQVWEVLPGQEPMQALRGNQPILETEVRGITQYFWRPQLSLKDFEGHIFIWTVQTLDLKGIPIPSTDENNMGRSEPRVFGVCDHVNKDNGDPGEDCSKGRKL
jgi:hypothetical protein